MTKIARPKLKRIKINKTVDDEDAHGLSDNEYKTCAQDNYLNEEALECSMNLSEEGLASPQHTTELETALPSIKVDDEAINGYNLIRTAENLSEDLKSRLGDRRWIKGQSSIYVDAFNLALGTVLDDEIHLFDSKEQEVFAQWKQLEYESQYLKTSAWHRINSLKYYGDICDISAAVQTLQSSRNFLEQPVPSSTSSVETHSSEVSNLGTDFTFADTSATMITTLEEASSLLSLEELKSISREAKIKGKNKADLLKALWKMSHSQSVFAWAGSKRSSSDLASVDDSNDEKDLINTIPDMSRDQYFLQKILAITGPCIRLSLPAFKLFERVHLVFYRSSEWTNKSLSTIILARIARRNFPRYIVSRSSNIFRSRSELLEFEAALKLQFEVDRILELNGNQGKIGLEKVLLVFDQVHPIWKKIVNTEQHREECLYEDGEGAYLRRFSPGWVYTRIIHKGVHVLGRLKHYEREYATLSDLLEQKMFHAARRGTWYQRKALLEEHYMFRIRPPPGISDIEQQKKHWRQISLKTCEAGLQDKDCHQIYHYDLQKRVYKLEKNVKIPKREKHNFEHVLLRKPIEVSVEGIQVVKECPRTTRNNGTGEKKPRSTKTIWIDEFEGGGECSVEEMCLSSYRSRGFKGYHTEGGIIRTLFAYLFRDVLFAYFPNVFQTEYQTCPLDLHTDAFFPSRISDINRRLAEIENGSAAAILRAVDSEERENRTCIIGLNWDFELTDLIEIVTCFDPQALAAICRVLAQEYRVRGSGLPDLFLWHVKRGEVAFAEVKSANDRLSETQRLWIHVLASVGLRVELCHAVAKEVRNVKNDEG
ncbi:Fanconi-associated nuclease 1 [Podosphaera aphanis]|nr:Fanconi-associated nuclease 1 [Podosphaera aphanis]